MSTAASENLTLVCSAAFGSFLWVLLQLVLCGLSLVFSVWVDSPHSQGGGVRVRVEVEFRIGVITYVLFCILLPSKRPGRVQYSMFFLSTSVHDIVL